MVPQVSVLVLLVDLIAAIPSPTFAQRRGRPPTYPDRLFVQALVIILVRRVSTVDGLLAILEQPTFTARCPRAAWSAPSASPSKPF
jgi:hypothetical protein